MARTHHTHQHGGQVRAVTVKVVAQGQQLLPACDGTEHDAGEQDWVCPPRQSAQSRLTEITARAHGWENTARARTWPSKSA
jgi:hypothetical protein